MKFRKLLSFLLALSLCLLVAYSSLPPGITKTKPSLSQTPGFFTENKGQWDSNILFVGTTDFGRIAFTQDAVFYQKLDNDNSEIVKLNFLNHLTPSLHGKNILPHYNNYFIGSDSSKWVSHCRNFTEIKYTNIWQNIDLRYFYTEQGLQHSFYGNQETQWKDLQFQVEGTHDVVYGSEFPYLDNIFSIQGENEIKYNTQETGALLYSTFLGGSLQDYAYDIALDGTAKAYVVGATYSTDFPTTPGSYQKGKKGNQDAYVIKLSANGREPLYSTYFGGSGSDIARSIALDNIGNAYITGETQSTDFPTTPGSYQKEFKGVADTFSVKFNTSGSALHYSTYLGGTWSDTAYDISVDESYNAYIAGSANSLDFPVTEGAYQTKNKGQNAFITKLNPKGTALLYSTFLGGSIQDIAFGIKVDNNGHTYVTGRTQSTDFPTTPGSYQNQNKGYADIFFTILDSSGSTLIYSSYLGGSDNDIAYSIALDSNKCAYITGSTQSTDFPISTGAYQKKLNGSLDGFVVKFCENGAKLLYSTYFGGSGSDIARSIALDNIGNAYITGETQSNNFPTTPGAYQKSNNGGHDAFMSKLKSDASGILYSTYFGGYYGDIAYGIAVDSTGNAYITGQTNSTNFPISQKPYQKSNHGGGCDAFISIINPVASDLKDGKITIVLTIGSKNAYVNQQLVVLDVAPFIDSGRTFVPFRFVGESLGAQVGYTTDASGRVATVTYQLGSTSIILYIGRKDALVNGRTVYLDVAPKIVQGRTVIPLRFVTEALGCKVDWDGQTMKVTITYPA